MSNETVSDVDRRAIPLAINAVGERRRMNKAIGMDPRDNAATALAAFESGDKVEVLSRTR